MRSTYASVRVAKVLLEDPSALHWGYETYKRSKVRPGVLYPILQRWMEGGLLEDGWEDPNTISGRPPRRYYKLTADGQRELRKMVADRKK